MKWSIQHKKLYNMLYNFIMKQNKNINESTFIIDNKDKLVEIINNSNYSNSTKESLFFMVARYLEINYIDDDKNIKLFKEAGYKITQIIKDKENDNIQDQKEQANYRHHNYFINILDSIDINTIQTKIGHYQYILLNMLVLQPPVRTSFYITCKFITNIKDNDKINNFVWICKNKVFYIINNDKVLNTSIYQTNKKLSYVKIEDDKLCKLIIDSFEKYPRVYLLEINDKPVTQPTYLNWLRKITDVKNINNDIMRSSYINWFYNKNITFAQKEHLAHQMRHSVLTSQKNYLKVLNDDKILCTKQDDKIISNEIISVDNKKYNKNRRDILYALNIKKVSPRENTLQKYNIKFNTIKQKYE